MSDSIQTNVLLAHAKLIRARNLLWISAGLLVAGVAVQLVSNVVGMTLAGFAAVTYIAALGFMSIAGNHLGQFGIKYLAGAVIGSAVLAKLVMPLAGFVAPIAVFFWLKSEVGAAYRAQAAADAMSSDGDPSTK